MPEYLSPGVYVEEVDRGPRTIEGVSTSTAGLVGVTERGPENVPVLVTSYPDFTRTYGGRLRRDVFGDDLWHFPEAVRGFFENGGRRAYVVRVASPTATRAGVILMDQGSPSGFTTILVSRAQAGDAVAVVADAAGLAGGEILRVVDNAASEYLTVTSVAALAGDEAALVTAAYAAYAPAAVPDDVTITAAAAAAAYAGQLATSTAPGATQILLDSPVAGGTNAFAAGDVLQIDAGFHTEIVEVESAPTDPNDLSLRLRYPLAWAHTAGIAVVRSDVAVNVAPPALARPVLAGDGLVVFAGAAPGGLTALRFQDAANPARSAFHIVAAPAAVALRQAAGANHPVATPATLVTLADDATYSDALTLAAPTGATVVEVGAALPGAVGAADWLRMGGGTAEFVQIESVDNANLTVTLTQPLIADHVATDTVDLQTAAAETTTLLEPIRAGDRNAILADPTGTPAAPNQVLGLGVFGDASYEYLEIASLATPQVLSFAAGDEPTLGHPAGTELSEREELLTVQALDVGGWGSDLRVRVSDEERAAVDTTVAAPAPAGSDVDLDSITGVERGTLVEVIDFASTLAAQADAGANLIELADPTAAITPASWLRLGRGDPEVVAVAGAGPGANQVTLAGSLRRTHTVGEAVDRMGADGLPRLAKVDERVGNRTVRFDGGLGFPVQAGNVVRSREFALTIDLVRDNPRTPGIQVVEATETHRALTLDSRHSRYIGTVIGRTDGELRAWDRRPEGQSWLVRVIDPLFPAGGPDSTQAALRVGPDLITEPVPGGRRRAVGRWLEGGVDGVAAIGSASFEGQDHVDPEQRSGIQALRNIEDISIVAVPGQVGTAVQQELIDHCERERYRFAVLDSVPGLPPTGAMVADVLAQRQRYDTRYAALYYPWPLIPDPFPLFPDDPGYLPVPPSGAMLGVYANTDNTDGVHKAPANEVVRGVVGFQRAVTKGEHDILNPGPVNVNVLRDFRSSFRGLRSFGARVITSDPAWKYVNVRRLFIFLERSLDIGLQWVTFEPNNEALWARVRRTISDFLTAVWRSGALMGQTAEEAYYVKCDRTTMTQNDIDNGRLIVEVGVAPVKPAEFVVVRISQWQGGSDLQEG